jgi:hypothetical protein
MSDDLDIGQVSSPDPVQQVKDNALGQMAKSEDITAYARERQDRDAEDRGEEIDEGDRASRIREALAKARQDTTEARQQNGFDQQPDLDQQYQSAEEEWAAAQAAEQTFEQEREQAISEGRFQQVAQGLKQASPQLHSQISDTMAVIDTVLNDDQITAFKRGITKGDATQGMAIAHRLSQTTVNPDGSTTTPEQKIEYLASLSPQQLEATLDGARSYLELESSISQQYAARYAAAPRRVTRAPAPFTRPRGGASAPRSLESLAGKENPADYIKARMAAMKREER